MDGDLRCPQACRPRHTPWQGCFCWLYGRRDRATGTGLLPLLPSPQGPHWREASALILLATQRHLVGLGCGHKKMPEAPCRPSPSFQHPTGHGNQVTQMLGCGPSPIPQGAKPHDYPQPEVLGTGDHWGLEMSLGRIQCPVTQGRLGAWLGRETRVLGH